MLAPSSAVQQCLLVLDGRPQIMGATGVQMLEAGEGMLYAGQRPPAFVDVPSAAGCLIDVRLSNALHAARPG